MVALRVWVAVAADLPNHHIAGMDSRLWVHCNAPDAHVAERARVVRVHLLKEVREHAHAVALEVARGEI